MTVSIHYISMCSNVLLTKPWQKEIKKIGSKKYPKPSHLRSWHVYGFCARLIGPIQLQIFFRILLGPFSACVWQDLSFAHQKSEKTTYIDNLVFSALSVLWGTVKKFRLKSDRHHTLPGELSGSLRQISPHKDAFFYISLTNIGQC